MSKKQDPYFAKNDTILDPDRHTSYKIEGRLGAGAFAQCYLVKTNFNEQYALKVIDYTQIKSKSVISKLSTEVKIHSSLDHPNIVKLYKHFKDKKYVYLVLQYCPNNDLDKFLKEKKSQRERLIAEKKESNDPADISKTPLIKECYVRKMMYQLVDALIYLHEEKNVIHRDLKLANIFLDNELNIFIGDFGLSAEISGNQKKRTICGTPNYIAPELLMDKNRGHSYGVDVWAFGVILYTLAVGVPPFQKKEIEEIYETIRKIDYAFPQDYAYSKYSMHLISEILDVDPENRPTLYEIKNHNFFVKKENKVESIIRNLAENNYYDVVYHSISGKPDSIEHFSKEYDYIAFSLPISRFNGVGYTSIAGFVGIYYYDSTNIVKFEDKIYYMYRKHENRKISIKKEEYLSEAELNGHIKDKHTQLKYFLSNYCRDFVKRETLPSHVIRMKKIRDCTLIGLHNGVIQINFNDDVSVVLAEGGRVIYAFDEKNDIVFCEKLKMRVLDIFSSIR